MAWEKQMRSHPDVVIISAGVASLRCARRLYEAGVTIETLEASNDVHASIHGSMASGRRAAEVV